MNINNLFDWVEFAIKIHKNGIPDGFIFTLCLEGEKRRQMYDEIVEKGIQIDFVRFGDSNRGFYSFFILGMQFHLF